MKITKKSVVGFKRTVKDYFYRYNTYKVAIKNLDRAVDNFGPLNRSQAKSLKEYKKVILLVDSAMEKLSDRERTFIQLKFFHRNPMLDIGEKLGCSQRLLYLIQKNAFNKIYLSLGELEEVELPEGLKKYIKSILYEIKEGRWNQSRKFHQ
jgi:DNA-directed RNA polymerase specialized sigma subunit